MKKAFFSSLFLTALLSVALLSCDEKDPVGSPQITKAEMLSTGSWKFSAAFVSAIDVSSQLPACQKDNILNFSILGTGIIDENLLKCNAPDPQTVPFNWNFTNAGLTELNISTPLFTGGSNVFTIVTLTQASLVLKQNISLGGGGPQEVIVNFTH